MQTLSNTISSNEEPDVEFVTIPVPGAELKAVAKKLLAAAGAERVEQVRSLTGGFRVPYAIAKEAGVLDRIAGTSGDDQAVVELATGETVTGVLPVDAAITEPTTVEPAATGAPNDGAGAEAGAAETEVPAAEPAKAATATKAKAGAKAATS